MKIITKVTLTGSLLAIALTGCSAPQTSNGDGVVESTPSASQSGTQSLPSPTIKKEASSTPSKTSERKEKATEKATEKPQKTATASGEALAALNKLKVSDEHTRGYQRSEFGTAWTDVDGNGCDTRNDTLAAHMTNVETSNGCTVTSGVLKDSYTLKTVKFTSDGRGGGIDIDHVVALSNGWKTGLSKSSENTRVQFANDPLNILPVDAGYNRTKGEKDASEWLPSTMLKLGGSEFKPATDCPYVARQVAVKSKYNLWVTKSEKSTMQTVLKACPGEKLPTGKSIVHNDRKDSASGVATVPSKTTKKTSPSPKKEVAKKNPNKKGIDPDMGTCGKAVKAGYGPYKKGVDPEYEFYIDRDKDGIVCEK